MSGCSHVHGPHQAWLGRSRLACFGSRRAFVAAGCALPHGAGVCRLGSCWQPGSIKLPPGPPPTQSSTPPLSPPQIFDKALFEPHFCELYSQLCHTLQKRLPEFDDPAEEAAPADGSGEVKRRKLNFRRLLLNKCQEEFEKGDAAMHAVAAREAKAKELGGKVRRSHVRPPVGEEGARQH